MRIAHVIDYFQPKMGYQETFLAREHARLGHDVYVVTSDRYSPIAYSGEAAKETLGNRIVGTGLLTEEGIKVWRLKTLFELPPIIWVSGVANKVQELNPDLVIVHGIANFSAIRIARLKKRVGNFKLIYDDHMTFAASRSKIRFLYSLFRYFFSPQIQQAADVLVAVADVCKRFMHKRYGIPIESIVTIPLGADDEIFRFDAVAREETRSQLSLNEDDIVFIYAGKIVPAKGPHILVEAGMQLIDRNENLKIVLLGNGPPSYIEGMKQKIQGANQEDRFIWHDAVSNKKLPKFYSAADVAVWPREASLSMMEAMACGLPIIISDTSEVGERAGYNNGLTYHGEDASDLAQQMQKLLGSKLRGEMGSNGRELIENELSWKIISRQFIESVYPR